VDWELVDLSVFFMIELREILLLFPLGGLVTGLLTGDTERFLFLVRFPGGAEQTDLDLEMIASLCFARLAAVLPNKPGDGDLLLVLLVSLFAPLLFPSLLVLRLPPSA